jgi:hypothetical protein
MDRFTDRSGAHVTSTPASPLFPPPRACAAPRRLIFGSRSLSVHLLRGAAGLGALIVGLWAVFTLGWPALAPLAVAAILLKGCPTCWTQGLFETLEYRRSLRRAGSKK